jgi:adenine deaminase
VTIALGDDTGIENSFPGYATLPQVERMAESGMTPQQVLVAVTRTPAQILRIDDMGSIAPGKQASFVVLDANPLDNLAIVRRISRVYLRGRELDRAAMRAEFRSQWIGGGNPHSRWPRAFHLLQLLPTGCALGLQWRAARTRRPAVTIERHQ